VIGVGHPELQKKKGRRTKRRRRRRVSGDDDRVEELINKQLRM
jgi:hypothetical protein